MRYLRRTSYFKRCLLQSRNVIANLVQELDHLQRRCDESQRAVGHSLHQVGRGLRFGCSVTGEGNRDGFGAVDGVDVSG